VAGLQNQTDNTYAIKIDRQFDHKNRLININRLFLPAIRGVRFPQLPEANLRVRAG
jgi:hypothetical protein